MISIIMSEMELGRHELIHSHHCFCSCSHSHLCSLVFPLAPILIKSRDPFLALALPGLRGMISGRRTSRLAAAAGILCGSHLKRAVTIGGCTFLGVYKAILTCDSTVRIVPLRCADSLRASALKNDYSLAASS